MRLGLTWKAYPYFFIPYFSFVNTSVRFFHAVRSTKSQRTQRTQRGDNESFVLRTVLCIALRTASLVSSCKTLREYFCKSLITIWLQKNYRSIHLLFFIPLNVPI